MSRRAPRRGDQVDALQHILPVERWCRYLCILAASRGVVPPGASWLVLPGARLEAAPPGASRLVLGGASSGASQVNSKVDALNTRTAAWNERNKRVVKMGEDLTQERDLWASECGNRRYREDDEIAIRNER